MLYHVPGGSDHGCSLPWGSYPRSPIVLHWSPDLELFGQICFNFLVIGSVYRGVEVRKVIGTGGETQQKTVNILSFWS